MVILPYWNGTILIHCGITERNTFVLHWLIETSNSIHDDICIQYIPLLLYSFVSWNLVFLVPFKVYSTKKCFISFFLVPKLVSVEKVSSLISKLPTNAQQIFNIIQSSHDMNSCRILQKHHSSGAAFCRVFSSIASAVWPCSHTLNLELVQRV